MPPYLHILLLNAVNVGQKVRHYIKTYILMSYTKLTNQITLNIYIKNGANVLITEMMMITMMMMVMIMMITMMMIMKTAGYFCHCFIVTANVQLPNLLDLEIFV